MSAKLNDSFATKYKKHTLKTGAMVSTSPTRYIKCRVKVLQYPNIKAAEAALPRIRRADPKAYIVPEESEYDLLKTTPPGDVVVR